MGERRIMRDQIKNKYLIAEIKRLSSEGFSISRISKQLDIGYKHAKRLKYLSEDNQQ